MENPNQMTGLSFAIHKGMRDRPWTGESANALRKRKMEVATQVDWRTPAAGGWMTRKTDKTHCRGKAFVGSMMVVVAITAISGRAREQTTTATPAPPQKVIIDTDIGDDVDDAFAVALALSNPHLQILGITTAWGDTNLRARLVERLLKQTGHADIPVAAGPNTQSGTPFTQAAWAEAFPEPTNGWPDAVDFILNQIRRNPGQVTLISLAPLSTVGALIQKDPVTFRNLKRVVMMGGSIRQGYGDLGYLPDKGPSSEYNIKMDIPAAKELFASGVPIDMMPLDSTQLKLDEVLRATLFGQKTPATDALRALYQQWASYPNNVTPTLYDAMAVAVVIEPALCPVSPMHLRIDDAGFTRVGEGPPNAGVCLHSDADQFFHFYLPQVLNSPNPKQ
jgi:purine nucleosidase